MAPIRKRTTARHKAASVRGKYAPPSHLETTQSTSDPSDAATNLKNDYFGFDDNSFRTTKKDKRMIKHGNLLAKVREASITKKKRRRPGKKLKTDLEGLEDALPDIEAEDEEWEGVDEVDDAGGIRKRSRQKKLDGDKLIMKTLKMRQGAMKRKRKMEMEETERMGKNLARLAQAQEQQTKGQESAGDARLKALRAFIGQTMETNKAFAAK